MDKELYEKAVTLQGEIKALKYELESTRDGSPNSGIEITVKTGYSDMGHDITRNMKLSGDMACDVWYLVRDVLKKRIHELEVEFEKLLRIMKITKENLHQAIAALRQCAKENEKRQTDTGAVRVTDLCSDVADYLERLPADPEPTPHEKMDVERWKEAVKASCMDRHYRSHFGLTETRDDYFVDGVLWADQHPALTWEDMMHIHKHLKDAMNYQLYEMMKGVDGQQKVYQNVLDRFLKERKVE